MRELRKGLYEVSCDCCGAITVVQHLGEVQAQWLYFNVTEVHGDNVAMQFYEKDMCPDCKGKLLALFGKG